MAGWDTRETPAAPVRGAPGGHGTEGSVSEAVAGIGRENRGRGEHVLLADDNEISLRLMEKCLTRFGYEVTCVSNGQEGLELCELLAFDLALLDLEMPGMGGLEAARRIRGKEAQEGGSLPIIGVTGHGFEESLERCLAAGMNACLKKPFRPAELLGEVRRWLEQRGNGPECAPPAGAEPVVEPAEASRLPVVDLEEALRRAGGDRAFLANVMERFVRDLPRALEELRGLLEAGQTERLRKEAHSLKGSAATLGAVSLTRAALRLEQAGKGADLDGSKTALRGLAKALEGLREHVSRPGWTGEG